MDAIATRTLLQILVSQGRQREALEMARGLLRESPGDRELERTVMNLEETIRAGDPFEGLTAEGRARIRARLERLSTRVRSRRRASGALPPLVATAAQIGDASVPPATEIACVEHTDDSPALLLDQVTSGVVSAYDSCAEAGSETVEPEVAREIPPPTAHETRGRKLRLLEAFMDRVARRKKGVFA